jgi:arylsulfatase A-like enzyme
MSERLLDRRWPWLVAATGLMLLLLSNFFELRAGVDADGRPTGSPESIEQLAERTDVNVLFILIDTLRADRLGSYGYSRDTSPGLDRLAADGVRFASHLSQSSWTKASMASLWTGMYPARTGITRFDDIIPEEARLPAEILKDAGFVTAGIWRNGWVAPTFGFEQGFDAYSRPVPGAKRDALRRANPTVSRASTDEDAVTSAVEFLRVHRNHRWFLYLHLMDLHEYLYDEQTALFGGTYSDIYDNSIRWVDDNVGVLLAWLAEMGLSEKTLVVIASDHGEAFQERGFEGHARQLFRESTEVPLIISFPFRLEGGAVVDTRTRNVDIWPTVLDVLGLESPAGIDGRSLLPEVLAAARREPLPEAGGMAITHLDQTWGQRGQAEQPSVAIAEGPLRYVRGRHGGVPIEQLFDARRDPAELEDISGQEAETVERLRAAADAYLETEPEWGEVPTRELGELELNQLRALGYALP